MTDILREVMERIDQFEPTQQTIFKLYLQEIQRRDSWGEKIPFISWPSDWEVQFYPSYDALLRGMVRLKSDPDRMVSFYLDGYGILGWMVDYSNNMKKIPYWEIANMSDDVTEEEHIDLERYRMNEVDELLGGIKAMLER